MFRKIGEAVLSTFKSLILGIPWFNTMEGKDVGTVVDKSMKSLLQQLLEELGFKAGQDFVVPHSKTKCCDFLVKNDIANQLMEDLLEGRIVIVRAHKRDGHNVRLHFRRVA